MGKEKILDLPNYSPSFKEVVGKYCFLPIKDEYRDDYSYFKLKKGDSLLLYIKKDSTYYFNTFFYNQGRSIDNLTGKITFNKNELSIKPTFKNKERNLYILGFKKSKKTGLYFFDAINSPSDTSDYEYYITYKKMK